MADPTDPASNLLRCSFCAKTQAEVKKLIAGPGVFICEECIALCNDILVGEGYVDLEMAVENIAVSRAELTAVARALDQATGALGGSNARLADETRLLAAGLHRRLQESPPEDNPE